MFSRSRAATDVRVLTTGATGFVGRAVVGRCAAEPGIEARAAVRTTPVLPPRALDAVTVGEIGPATDWTRALAAVDAVVHCAARVHVMRDTATDPLAEFRRVNVEGTLNLARQTHAAGARRFVFLSSIKVNGEGTEGRAPYRADDEPAPVDAYGISKREAEDALRVLASQTGLEVVIIRPVLVYGPGVKGNFLSMLRWLQRGVPLPLGAIRNSRSMVALDNLVDLIVTAVRHPAAAQRTFLVSDGDDVSTSELLRRMAGCLGTRAHLLPVPPPALRAALRVVGKGGMAQRLCDSLQVDIGPTIRDLSWTPPVDVTEGLRRTARWFLDEAARSHGRAPLREKQE